MKNMVSNNRKNGKKYEGELVKVLKQCGISARLGRSNEEGDVILPDYGIVIEVKSTSLKDRYRISKSPEQYYRLRKLSQEIWYAVRYKGEGISGWRFYPIPGSIIVLRKNEGYTLQEYVLILGAKIDQEGTSNRKEVKLPSREEEDYLISIRASRRGRT